MNRLTVTTRLGQGIAATGMLSEERMKKSVSVIAALSANARHAGFMPAAYATSAVRDAKNQVEFLDAVERSCGVRPDVLSGEREAMYAYAAATGGEGGLIDIGGASMQIACGGFAQSFPIGCVRGRDIALGETGAVDCDDGWEEQQEALKRYFYSIVRTPRLRIESCAGVGGTITTLAAWKLGLKRFDAKTVDGCELEADDVKRMIAEFSTLGSGRRQCNLLTKRHDVILYGAAILDFAMDALKVNKIRVSIRDGLDGYLDYLTGRLNFIL